MEAWIVLILIFLAVVLIIFPLWAFIKIRQTSEEIDAQHERIRALESEVSRLRDRAGVPSGQSAVTVSALSPTAPRATDQALDPIPPPLRKAPSDLAPSLPPPLPEPPVLPRVPRHAEEPIRPATAEVSVAPAAVKATINWEQFMGVKLIAWLGGLAAFLAAVFFVKYSFEHDLIPPEVRVALGFLFGTALVAGGTLLSQKRYAVTAQTLCGAGIVSLYAVTFACRSIYHFSFFGVLPTFGLMVLITATAFLWAVRLEARVVAVLGMLGGFLTPILLATGQDNPLGLFTYIALLDIGLIAVALVRRWHFLIPLCALATIAMEAGWAHSFLEGDNISVAITVCLVFDGLFLAGAALAKRLKQIGPVWSLPVAALVSVSFLFAGYMADATPLGLHPAALFGFILLADLCVLALVLIDDETAMLSLPAGLVVFVLLGWWTLQRLNPALLNWGLAAYFGFAVLHSAFPLVLQRLRPGAAPTGWGHLFPPMALLLVMGPVLSSHEVSFMIWPAVLLIDGVAIVLAWLTMALTGVLAVLGLTLLVAALWLFKLPAEVTGLSEFLVVVGGFALLFFGVGLWFLWTFSNRASGAPSSRPPADDIRAQLPALSALLPFILLVMAVARLPALHPSSVFGLALLLVVLTLGLARLLALEWLSGCGLAGVLALLYTWQSSHFGAQRAGEPLAWAVGFYANFALFPFLFRRVFADTRGPWITAALAGPLIFPFVFNLVGQTWPNDVMGLLPMAFALPALASLVAVLRLDPSEHPRRLGRLALFGGTALFFVTLIFPIQFSRQWITIGWALEGAALLWLFHRVPHRGLPIAGLGLLIAAFSRLAFNPAVLSYHLRGDTPVFNWYLYTYGVSVACLLIGAHWLAAPRDRVMGLNAPGLLNSLGVILLFLLVNIEVADFFGRTQETLTFEFSGNLARDMTYTIAWALFAFGLLMVGIGRRSKAARYSALALLGITLLKVFFHDLASLGQLYRVGALLVVAVIAILASFVYQRFLPPDERKMPNEN